MVTKQTVALDHCHKATVLGNIIAIHMLEYITAATPKDGFSPLAREFMDVCQIMWSVEAGLVEFSRTKQALPSEMVMELDHKFQTVHSDFQVLDHWLSRSLNDEKKGKFSRGLKKVFVGNEIPKMRAALNKTRESLRMSALMFQWSLGEEKVNDSVGIGYTALAAALNRIENRSTDKTTDESFSSTTTLEAISAKQIPQNVQVSEVPQHNNKPLLAQGTFMDPQSPRRSASLTSIPIFAYPPREDSIAPTATARDDSTWAGALTLDFTSNISSISPRKATSSNHTDTGSTVRSMASQENSQEIEDLRSSGMSELESLSLEDEPSQSPKQMKVVRVAVTPSKMPRWAPRNSIGAQSPSLKINLITAIRERHPQVVEQLLDRGVSPSTDEQLSPMNEAIRRHDMEIVRLLLLFGADPNTVDTHGVTPLLAALEEGFLDAASILLKYGADTNLPPAPDRNTPFIASILKQDSNFVRLFLMYGADVNYATAGGDTVLTKMISKDCNAVIATAVLRYGADANAKNREGQTPLLEAITAGRVDLVILLLEHGANPNLPGPKHMLWPATYQPACLKVLLAHGADYKNTPGIMELATSINNIESVRILLQAGVNPNAKKDGTYTPLCSSIRDNRPDIFHLLLSSGADPNVPASEYPCFKCVTHNRPQFLPHLIAAGANLNSPKGIIETAIRHNNMEALTWLLEQGVSPNDAAPDIKATPLTTAIHLNRPELVDVLLKNGANPNVRGQDWPVCMAVRHPAILERLLPALAQPRAFKGVMEMAVSADKLESVKLLLAAGVSVEDRNGGVFSPLTTAIRERHKEIVRYLLDEAGADPNAPGEHLPIVKALRRYEAPDTEIIEMLLAKGADPNKVYRGHNGIIQAIEMGDAQILRMLIEKWGVDLDAIDDSGRTPIEIAEIRGWDEGQNILIGGKKAV
ncbi:ankyrin repeat-containing domain protein [Xylariaceae sp. FL0255]|nr:ankyrin repeat-containing domain protein [Xylariaceae sp. FL0255]